VELAVDEGQWAVDRGLMTSPHDNFQSVNLDASETPPPPPRTIGFRRVPCEEPTAKDTMTGTTAYGDRLGAWRDAGYRNGHQEPYA
jgi:hypothetical protein